jgi:hypothetical protein
MHLEHLIQVSLQCEIIRRVAIWDILEDIEKVPDSVPESLDQKYDSEPAIS